MTAETDVISRAAEAFPPSSPTRIGAEVEWLVFDREDLRKPIPAEQVAGVADGRLPAGGAITIEPGGQLELVTRPYPDPVGLVDAVAADTAELVGRFQGHGLVLVSLGLDPIRPPRRTLDTPRYEAMEKYFSARSPAGLQMMNLTASFQINIGFGPNPSVTWRRAQAVAPVLMVAFANSPTTDGDSFQSASCRQQIWAATDPTRTRPACGGPEDWAAYVLDANLMLRWRNNRIEPQLDELTFGECLQSSDPPTRDDLELHLTTLFPPLKPRGYLELRMLDALPPPGRVAAIASVWAVLTDPDVGDAAEAICRAIPDAWCRAAQAGLSDPTVREAAANVLDLAARANSATAPSLADACKIWRDEHVLSPNPPQPVAQLVDRAREAVV